MLTIKCKGITLLAIATLFSCAFAGTQPKFTLTPLTPTQFPMAYGEQATIEYNVTNNTKLQRTLNVETIPGITPVQSGAGYCSIPFTLNSKQSCILALSLNSSQMPTFVASGPKVCAITGDGNNNLDPFLCSQPSQANSLNIQVVRAKRPTLTVSPASLTLVPHGSSQSFTVTNTSRFITARNIVANLADTALEGNVTQDASNCRSVLPQQSCLLTFTAIENSVSLTSFPIAGVNTGTVGASIQVVSDTTANIVVTGSPLVLDPGQTGTITITNTSTNLTATNVTAHNVPPSITLSPANGCATINHPNGTCTLSFTAGNTAVPQTIMPIYGDNTSITKATIAVNNPPFLDISFVGPSTLTLAANGISTGTMTVQNDSGTTIAAGLTANFTNTALNGFVTATVCPEIAPNSTCTITYTAGTTTLGPIEFPIYGPETDVLKASITIVPPTAYLSSATSNVVYYCPISTNTNIIGGCTSATTSVQSPKGIALNPNRTKAYIANSGDNTVTVCDVRSDANLQNCVTATPVSSTLNTPAGLSIDPTGTYAYIANTADNTISSCLINSTTGLFTSCANSGAVSASFANISDIVIKPTNDFAYITNFNNTLTVRCNISNGTLSNCTALIFTHFGGGISGARISAINNQIYFGGNDATHVHEWRCQIDANGALTDCLGMDAATTGITGGDIAVNSENTFTYQTITDSAVYLQCPLDANGNIILSSCVNQSLSPGYNTGIALLD
mgnify:FL=1